MEISVKKKNAEEKNVEKVLDQILDKKNDKTMFPGWIFSTEITIVDQKKLEEIIETNKFHEGRLEDEFINQAIEESKITFEANRHL